MDKAYNHNGTEDGLYADWEASGAMCADNSSDKPPFTIALPPPNVTGQLHLGHAAMLSIEDVLIRYKKMKGHEVLWIPGTDHAAIATENVVLKHLGIASREELSREDFMKECRKFAQEKHDTIVGQMKKMGAWLDWSREVYTFDEARNIAVNKIFKDLYEDGLIERGHRMIHWSVGAQSVLSDDELEWEDRTEPFYILRCGEFLVGTVRSETKCSDSPVVVHPEGKYVRVKHQEETFIFSKNLFDDKERLAKELNFLEGEFELLETLKGKDLAGQEFEYDTYAGKRKFFVLADEEVIDMDKGTGAMTISVCHSADDYLLAQKHKAKLKDHFFEKIDMHGKMTAQAGACEGMAVDEARKKSAEIMREKGLLAGEDKSYIHRVPICYRSDCVVEPMISPQWFVMVEKEFTDKWTGETTTLKKLTTDAVREGGVDLIPKRFEKTYFHWIDNLRDWCISRQIWWGHQIPVWYDEAGGIHLPKEQKLLFARHGESEANRDKVVAGGVMDAKLTDKGHQQAKDLAEALKDRNITKIIASPMKRAQQTAQVLSDALGIEIETIAELKEIDYGELTGTKMVPGISNLELAVQKGTGETLEALEARAQKAWELLKNKESEGEVLIVGHNTFYSIMDAVRRGKVAKELLLARKNWHLENAGLWETSFFKAPEGEVLRQDKDTLDTWFSSALWPMSPLGWPSCAEASAGKPNNDFEKFYPSDVLETGWDILFFWVARMIMFGRYATGKNPFHTTYLHGMVTDEHGKKMSKSKGNGINPLDVIEKFGADAVRLSLVIGTSPGNPIPLGEHKIGGYRNFVNKLWNAGRFVTMQNPSDQPPSAPAFSEDSSPRKGESEGEPSSLADKWIASRFSTVAKKVSDYLENYQISAAGDAIYHFVWDEFCDWYIEASKAEPNPAFLKQLFGYILKLTHPLCPFITESLWKEVFGAEDLLILEDYPAIDFSDSEAEEVFEKVQILITKIRKARADAKINPKEKIKVLVSAGKDVLCMEKVSHLVCVLAQLSALEIAEKIEAPEKAVKLVIGGMDVYLDLPFDEKAEHERIEKEKVVLAKSIQALEGRLSNQGYLEKAPESLVEQTKKELAEAQEKLDNLSR